MSRDVTATELRYTLHNVLQDREKQLDAIRDGHESAASELYRLLSRKRTHASAFPAVDLEDVGKDGSFEKYDDWKRQLELGVGPSKVDAIRLPSIPPPSPPVGATVFPDEVQDLKQEAAPSPAEVPVAAMNRRASSRKGTPAVPAPSAYLPAVSTATTQPVAGPSRLASPPISSFVSMSDVQPRSRRVFSPSLAPTVADWVPLDNYNVASSAPPTPPHILMPLESEYSANLPQIPPIPRRRKRKGSKGDDGPNDPYKLQAMYTINPISNSLATSSKCVMSSDWKIAMAELRHIRTMERIEQKMANGRWSLRQPKKLKAPPVRKGHWDHLLEEMEWMRLDFTEERRWKRVLALEFAIQVVEWHLSSEIDRAQLMVGSKGWQKDAPRPALAPLPRIKIDFQSKKRDSDGFYVFAEDGDVYMDSEDEDTRETAPKRTTQKQTRKEDPGDQEDVQNSSGEVLDEIMPRRGKRGRARPKRLAEEMDEDHAEEDVPLNTESEDPTQPQSASEESEMNSAEIKEVEMADNSPSKADVPKTNENSKDEPIKTDTDADAEGEEDAEGEVDAEGELDAQGEDDGGSADIVDGVIGLEDITNADGADAEGELDPDADGEGEIDVAAEVDQAATMNEPPRGIRLSNGRILSDRFTGAEQLTLVRAPLLDAAITTGTVDLPAIEQQLVAQNGEYYGDGPLTLEEIFPDVSAYSGPAPFEEGQAPRYRLEEGHMPYHRPAHTSRIMDLEPIFVSTLQPASNIQNGKWDLHDGPWYDDAKGSTDITHEVTAASTSIFQGRTSRVSGFHGSAIAEPSSHKLRTPLTWSPEEDAVLKRLVGMYPFNWALVADSFNSEIVTIPTEKRLPYDCYERWDLNYGPDADKKRKIAAVEAAKTAAAAATAATNQAQAQAQAATNGNGQVVAAPTSAVGPGPNGTQPNPNGLVGPKPTPQTTGVAVPTLPGQNGTEAGPSDAPPPPGLSKREAKAAARNKYEGSKKAIRHQALYDAVRRLIRRRETSKQKNTSATKQVINIHDSHSSYLNLAVLDPATLSAHKHEADMRRNMQLQQQQQNMGRDRYMMDLQRQRALAAMSNGNGQVPQQQPIRPGPPGQGGPNQAQAQGQPRLGPNGQPLPQNIAPHQQQLLSAVAAAAGANRQGGASTPGGSIRPLPQQNQGAPMQGQQRVPVQQMQQMEAQMNAARMVQAQAQQAQNQRVASGGGGTPQSQPGNLAPTPYQGMSDLAELMPNSDGTGNAAQQHMQAQSSPAMMNANLAMHSSPQVRPGQMPLVQAPHLRAQSAGQVGNVPNNNALMAQIAAQITASGGSVNQDTIKSYMQRYHQMQAQIQAQAQQVQQQQQQQQQPMGTPQQGQGQGQGTPQMGQQGLPHFARSPSMGRGQRHPTQ